MTQPTHTQLPEGITIMQTPAIGRIVHYRVQDSDLDRLCATLGGSVCSVGGDSSPKDYRYYEPPKGHGNHVHVGDILPMTIVRVWPLGHYVAGETTVNGQALLDGVGALWVLSAKEGTEPGTWSWPPRV